MFNVILSQDAYKFSHWKQIPPRTEFIYSYLESRGGDFPETVFFGLQYYLKRYLAGSVVTEAMVDEAHELVDCHMGKGVFNRKGWMRIVRHHGGRLPLSIKAVPEGMVVPTHNVLMTVENTDPELPWLTNVVETLLSKIWYPITVATLSHEIRKMIRWYLDETGDATLLPFKFHDFGYRGVSVLCGSHVPGIRQPQRHLFQVRNAPTRV